ncbi:tail assembly chaperone [Marinococcus halophilus]|uniref:tail assembly chaperone n=1 Tax=Marinococcus halophilus TaxID=1371 RepID=UPI0009A89F30|nr:tail assembly chaperone [Marinococcus halophilus]
MHINYKGKDLQLKFNLTAIRQIDKTLGFGMDDVQMGQGIGTLVPNLESGNMIAVAAAVEGGLAHLKKKFGAAYIPSDDDEMFDLLNDVAEQHGGDLQPFADEILDELGKQPATRSMLSEEQKAKYKVEEAQTPVTHQETPMTEATTPMNS